MKFLKIRNAYINTDAIESIWLGSSSGSTILINTISDDEEGSWNTGIKTDDAGLEKFVRALGKVIEAKEILG